VPLQTVCYSRCERPYCRLRPPTESPFHLEISDYNGAMAYGYEYHLGDDRFSVVWFGDLAGEQPKEVFASARSPEGRQQL
jgi:hypothetical protein